MVCVGKTLQIQPDLGDHRLGIPFIDHRDRVEPSEFLRTGANPVGNLCAL
jgi:hypothetical protein